MHHSIGISFRLLLQLPSGGDVKKASAQRPKPTNTEPPPIRRRGWPNFWSCIQLQVGRLNPAELKAQKLARSGASGGGNDRNAKPDVDERCAINEILAYPPNRCRFYILALTTGQTGQRQEGWWIMGHV